MWYNSYVTYRLQEGMRAGLMGELAKTIRLGTYVAVGITLIWGVVDFFGDVLGR